MKKLLLIIIALVFILVSCQNGDMDGQKGYVDPENEGLEYLTVTYHSEGHTSGEVPVDPKQYSVPYTVGIPPQNIGLEFATVLDCGTLKREGYAFRGWKMRRPEAEGGGHYNSTVYPSNWQEAFDIGIQYEGRVAVIRNIDLDAVWVY